MTLRRVLRDLASQEDLNFLLTNRLPRRMLTHLAGPVSRSENPLVRSLGFAAWRLFGDLDLSDSNRRDFRSLHDCFTRELRPGARPIDPDPASLVSPCDAIVGAEGLVEQGSALQAKGMAYALQDLLGDTARAERFAGGRYVTLRLTAGMYHRFHAPAALRMRRVTYFTGDTWNVNPIALARIERLFCRNERAALECVLDDDRIVTFVPVAAILVASIRLHALDVRLHLGYRGPNEIQCDVRYERGAEMGWFEHGSTIIVFVPPGFALAPAVSTGHRIRMGEALLIRERSGD